MRGGCLHEVVSQEGSSAVALSVEGWCPLSTAC